MINDAAVADMVANYRDLNAEERSVVRYLIAKVDADGEQPPAKKRGRKPRKALGRGTADVQPSGAADGMIRA